MNTRKCLIACTGPIFRHGIAEIVGPAAFRFQELTDHPALITALANESCDILIVSSDLLSQIRNLKELLGRTANHTIVLYDEGQTKDAGRFIRAGVRVHLDHDCSTDNLREALAHVGKDTLFAPPAISAKIFRTVVEEPKTNTQLSRREDVVLKLLVHGLSNKEIANQLEISIRTAEKHRQSIMDKLNIHKVTELVRFAIVQGLVPVEVSRATV